VDERRSLMTSSPWGSELLTTAEVSAYLRVGPATIHRMLKDGTLPGVKIGKSYRVRRADLEAWYEARRVDQTP
jgi:excisionase family DNA binding protein